MVATPDEPLIGGFDVEEPASVEVGVEGAVAEFVGLEALLDLGGGQALRSRLLFFGEGGFFGALALFDGGPDLDYFGVLVRHGTPKSGFLRPS